MVLPLAGYDLESKFKLTGETGSYRYMAPEVFRHEPYNFKVCASADSQTCSHVPCTRVLLCIEADFDDSPVQHAYVCISNVAGAC